MPKPFTWSYSGLTLFEQCAKRFFHERIAKDVKEEKSEHQDWGDFVHKSFHNRVAHKTKLPPELSRHEALLSQFDDKTQFEIVHTERKWAIDRNYRPTGYFDNNVWGRCLGDLVAVLPSFAGASPSAKAVALDWKTGKIREDETQLKITSAFVFEYYPHVQVVDSAFVWLKDDKISATTMARGERMKVWAELLPRINAMEQAIANSTMPANPSRLCGWCPVKNCAHHP